MDTKKWTYTNPDTGEKEEVSLERWIWGALYEDDTELHQFTDDGVFHRISEIDQNKVKTWVLYNIEGYDDGRIYLIIPRKEDGTLKEVSLIHKYRNIVLEAGTPQETRHKVYVFGFKLKGQKSFYNFVMPNNTIVQSHGEQQPQLTHFIALK